MGLEQAALDSFPEEFRQGMAARATRLGDTGRNAPDTWEFGNDPDRNHVFFALYGRTLADRDRMLDHLRHELAAAGGAVEVTHVIDAEMLANRREHFGYADGFGQPSIKDSGAPHYPGQGTLVGRPVAAAGGGRVRARMRQAKPGSRSRCRTSRVLGTQRQLPRLSQARAARPRVSRLPRRAGPARLSGSRAKRNWSPPSSSAAGAAGVRWRSHRTTTTRASPPTGWKTTTFGYANDAYGRRLPARRAHQAHEPARRRHRRRPRAHPSDRPPRSSLWSVAADGGPRRWPEARRGLHGHQRQHPLSVRVPADRMDQQRRVHRPVEGRRRSRFRRAARRARASDRPAGRHAEEHLRSAAFVTLKGGGYYFIPSITALRFIAGQTS